MIPLNLLLNPKVIEAVIICMIAVAVFIGGYREGEKTVQSKWDKEKAQMMESLAAAAQRAVVIQQAHTEKIASISDEYQASIKQKDVEKDAAVAAAFTRGMLLHGAKCTPRATPPITQTPPGPGSSDGTADAELSDEDAKFLLTLAADADKVVEQLTACQRILKEDRQEVAK